MTLENKHTDEVGYSLENDSLRGLVINKNGKFVADAKIPKSWISRRDHQEKPLEIRTRGFVNGIALVEFDNPTSSPNYFTRVSGGFTRSGIFVDPLAMVMFKELFEEVYRNPSILATINLREQFPQINTETKDEETGKSKYIEIINIFCDITCHAYDMKLRELSEKGNKGISTLVPEAINQKVLEQKINKVVAEMNAVTAQFKAINGIVSVHQDSAEQEDDFSM
jgi:hypothetical protein